MRPWLWAPLVAVLISSAGYGQGRDLVFDPNKEYELEIVTWTADIETEGLTWEWLVKEYQRTHPNVRIKKGIQSNRTYAAWATTQFKSGFAPDVMQCFPWKAHQWGAEQGQLVPLRRFLNRPNPYDKRYPLWTSCLYEELLELNADPYYGEIWTVPISLNTQRFYYNKDIFKSYGLKPPETYTELGELCRRIRERGEYIPIAMPRTLGWLAFLGSAVNYHLVDEFDLIKKDGDVTTTEVLIGALRGMWDSNTDAMYSFHKLVKKMSDQGWFQEGWAGYDQNQTDNLFTNGKAAMTREGYWMKEGFEKRINKRFEFGAFREPAIDKEFAGVDAGRMLELMASYGSELAVTKKCEERGSLAAAIDFLQWMTSPETAVQTGIRRGAMPSTRGLDDQFTQDILVFKPEVGGRPHGPTFSNVSPARQMQFCLEDVAPLYESGEMELSELKGFMSRLHDRFIDLARRDVQESTRRGIFKASQLYAKFIYEQDELARRIAAETDPSAAESLTRSRAEVLMSMGMTLDNLKDTEDNVVALIAAAYPEEGAAGYRHVPVISKSQGVGLQQLGMILLAVSFVALIVYVLRKNRLSRMLGLPEKSIYLFIFPTLLFVLTFSYYPALSGIYHAFTRWDGVAIDEFIAMANFKELLRDQVLVTSILNLLWMTVVFFIKIVPPLVIAVVLYRVASERLRYYFRVMFVLPLVVPGIVYWMVWKLLYQPAPAGVFNGLLIPLETWLQQRGLDVQLAHNWLADPRTALGAIIFLGFPWVNTLGVLIYMAGLENIDPNLFEAADIDGAGPLKKFWHIELPLLARQIKLNLVLGIISVIQGYGTILFMTKGGPAYSTTVPGYQMYSEAFDYGRMGYASAIGLVMFIVILAATMATSKAVKPQD